MRRGSLLTCAIATLSWACTQDFSIFDPKPDDGGGSDTASGDSGGGDSGQDAAPDVVVTCTLPSGCQSDAGACGQGCTSTYNTCVTNCGGNQGCKSQCKTAENTCFTQCQATCETCSGQGSICAAQCQTAVGF